MNIEHLGHNYEFFRETALEVQKKLKLAVICDFWNFKVTYEIEYIFLGKGRTTVLLVDAVFRNNDNSYGLLSAIEVLNLFQKQIEFWDTYFKENE